MEGPGFVGLFGALTIAAFTTAVLCIAIPHKVAALVERATHTKPGSGLWPPTLSVRVFGASMVGLYGVGMLGCTLAAAGVI